MNSPSQCENGSHKEMTSHPSQATLVHTKGNSSRPWSVLEKVLLALVLIFFLAFVVFVALYADKLSEDDEGDKVKTMKGKLMLFDLIFLHECDN